MLASGLFGYVVDYLLWWMVTLSMLIHTWCFFRFFPRKVYRKIGLIAGNLLVFVSMLSIVALGGETYYRFLCVETDPFGLSLPAQKWFAMYVRHNSLGCRDDEWAPEKPPDTYRIAFIGDSFTYGWGIEDEADRFADLIERRLGAAPRSNQYRDHQAEAGPTRDLDPSRDRPSEPRASARANVQTPNNGPHQPRYRQEAAASRFEILNVAKPGWGTADQAQPAMDMIDVYKVDEVILCYVPNDIEKLIPRPADFDPVRPPIPTWFNPTSSALVDYLYYRLVAPRKRTVFAYHDWLAAGFADTDIWRRHQAELYELISYASSRNVKFRIVLLPFLRTSGQKLRLDRLHATLRMFFEANGVPVVDLLQATAEHNPDELVVSSYDAHPNEAAHALFADAIWEEFFSE
jgi:lysophospholipase L1-like esterase